MTEPPVGATPPPVPAARPRRDLHEALRTLDPKMADIYGGLVVIEQDQNPHRRCQAAHSARELMDGLARYVGVGSRAVSDPMKPRARQLCDVWIEIRDSSQALRGRDGAPPIEAELNDLFKELEDFTRYMDEHRPAARDEAQQALIKLDVSGRPLAPAVAASKTKIWMNLRAFFTPIAHGREVGWDEFESRLEELEELLITTLRPKTFADQDAMDALIEGGPPE